MAVLAGPAMAQRGDDHGRGGGGGERGGGRPPAAAHAAPAPRAAPAAPAAAPTNRAEAGRQSMQHEQVQRTQSQNRGRNGNNRPDFNRGGNDHRPDFNRGGNNNRPSYNRGGNNNRPDFNRGGRNNWSQYHRAFNAPQRYRYRGSAYHRPPGFSYRRWNYGDFLPSLYWGSSYWINDSSYYDLMPAPPGTVWVRYGDDAVLIDRYTGEVIQVEYSVFY
jgi:Ni/Co efflux regulator RcnB